MSRYDDILEGIVSPGTVNGGAPGGRYADLLDQPTSDEEPLIAKAARGAKVGLGTIAKAGHILSTPWREANRGLGMIGAGVQDLASGVTPGGPGSRLRVTPEGDVESPSLADLSLEGLGALTGARQPDVRYPGALVPIEEDPVYQAARRTRTMAVAEPVAHAALAFATDPTLAAFGPLSELVQGGKLTARALEAGGAGMVPDAALTAAAQKAVLMGKAAGAAERGIGASFVPGMVEGAYRGGQEFLRAGQEEGYTSPAALRAGTETALDAAMAALVGTHAVRPKALPPGLDIAEAASLARDRQAADLGSIEAAGRAARYRQVADDAASQAGLERGARAYQTPDLEAAATALAARDLRQQLEEQRTAEEATAQQQEAFFTPDLEAAANAETARLARERRQAEPVRRAVAEATGPGGPPRLIGEPALTGPGADLVNLSPEAAAAGGVAPAPAVGDIAMAAARARRREALARAEAAQEPPGAPQPTPEARPAEPPPPVPAPPEPAPPEPAPPAPVVEARPPREPIVGEPVPGKPPEPAPAPSPAQMEAGNYAHGHRKWAGLDIAVETAKGGERVAKDGSWRVPDYPADYGYVKRTKGKDGDQVDVFMGDAPQSRQVFVIDQINPKTGKYDEAKAMLGFPDQETALATYRKAYPDIDANQQIGGVTAMSVDAFKRWIRRGDTTKPLVFGRSRPGGRQAAPPEGLVDRGVVDAQAARDRFNTQPGVPEGEGRLQAPLPRANEQVQPDVRPLVGQGEVGGRVVEPVPVDVVRDLVTPERPTEQRRQDQAVLETLSPDAVKLHADEPIARLVPGEATDVATGRRPSHPGTLSAREERPEPTEQPRRGERRMAELPVSVEQRQAQRRAETAQRLKLPEEHPAVAEVLGAQAEARTDPLTGLGNKLHWTEIQKTVDPAKDHVGVVDLKRFKPINDKYGHEAGDTVLKHVADMVRKHFGEDGARFGGDEFGIILRGVGLEEARAKAEAFRADLVSHKVRVRNGETGETVDIPGVEAHLGIGRNAREADTAANLEAAPSRVGGRGERPGERAAEPGAGALPEPGVAGRASRAAETPAEVAPPAEPAPTEPRPGPQGTTGVEAAAGAGVQPSPAPAERPPAYPTEPAVEGAVRERPLDTEGRRASDSGEDDPAKRERAHADARQAIDDLRRRGTEAVPTGAGVPPSGPREAGSGVRTRGLAVTIPEDLERRGWIDLRGHQVSRPDDLATVSQVFRDPRFETFRVYYTKGDRIVAHEGITSRVPDTVLVFTAAQRARQLHEIRDRMRRLEADGYWLQHNHPSGKPIPSKDDVILSARMAEAVPGFKGHVIIDGETYGLIPSDVVNLSKRGAVGVRLFDLPQEAIQPERYLVPSVGAAEKGRLQGADLPLEGPAALAALGNRLRADAGKDFVTILYTDAGGRVRAVQDMPAGLFQQTKAAADYLRGRQRAFGAPYSFAYHPGGRGDLVEPAQRLMDQPGALRDAHIGTTSEESTRLGELEAIETGDRTPEQQAEYRDLAWRKARPSLFEQGVQPKSRSVEGLKRYNVAEQGKAPGPGGYPPAGAPQPSTTPPGGPGAATGGQAPPPTAGTAQVGAAPQAPGAAPSPPAGFTMPEWRLADRVATYFQDRLRRLETVEGAVRKQGGVVGAKGEDIKAAADALGSKVAARMDDVRQHFVDPLTQTMGKKIPLKDLDDYMAILHAPDRDAVIARRTNGATINGSGWTPQERTTRWAELEQKYGGAKGGRIGGLEPAADIVRKMRDEQLRVLEDGGLISQAQAQGWRQEMGDNYVPFRTAEIDAGPGTGQGFDIRGRESKAATGRSTKADSPVAFMLQQLQRAVVRAEKNKVDQQFADFVRTNSLFEMDKQHERTELDAQGKVRTVRDTLADQKDFSYKVNGEQHRIDIASVDPLLDRALRNMSATETNLVVSHLGKLNRAFSQAVTSLNPAFIFTNFARDVQQATANVTAEHGARVAKDALTGLPRAMKEMFQAHLDPAKASQMAKEFKEDGGSIGWYSVDRIPELEKKLSAAGPGARNTIARAAGGLKDLVEATNKSVENGTRFATYVALRKAGASRAKAANAARNVTLDFTKKGEAGPTINALYAFFNANVQGAKRLKEVVIDNPRGRAVGASVVALGLAMDAYNRANAGDANEDGTNDYDAIPDYVKQRNFVVMRGEGKRPLLFPMPYGFNILHTAGRQIMAALAGAVKPAQAASGVVGAAYNAFNPLGGEGDFVQTLSPTMLDPFVQHATNRTWTGRPLQPEGFPGAPKKPSSEMYYRNVSPAARAVAKFLNKATGGDEITPGYLSWSPEVIAHYADAVNSYVSGGLGIPNLRFAVQASETAKALASGETPELRQIPVVNRFLYEESAGLTGQRYRQNVEDLDQLEMRYQAYRKKRDFASIDSLPLPLLRVKRQVDSIDKRIRLIRKAVKAGRPAADADQLIEDLENRANRLVAGAREASEA